MIVASLANSLFHLPIPVGEKILRALLVYVFLVVALRVGGKRELAQLNTLDFVVLLAVANAVQNGIIGNDNSVTGAVVGASVLFVANGAVAILLFRHHRLRRIVEGSPTVLITDGVVDAAALEREHLTEDDLLVAVEREGAASFAEVASAVLEPGGSIVTELATPSEETQHYLDLKAELVELRALVARLAPGGAAPQA